jgi:hypothetical protein
MDVPRHLVDHFVLLTNAEPQVASQLLGDNGLNFEAAVASFFAIQEAGGAPVVPTPQGGVGDDVVDGAAAESAAAALAADEAMARRLAAEAPEPEPEVRPPMPETVEQILPGGGSGVARGRSAHTVDDPFLRSDGSAHGDHLAAMFRPPEELVCRDDFDAAMSAGAREKKWLLVNMQRTGVFACLVLNRDVWGDAAVRELVASRFLFWQRDENTEDGRRYKQFYPYADVPHVAVVDPRSGERLLVWGGDGEQIGKDALVNALVDLCDAEHWAEDAEADRAPAAIARLASARTRSGSASSAAAAPIVDLEKDRMETEDAQIAAAIAASMAGRTVDGGRAGAEDVDGDGDVVVVDGSGGAGPMALERHTSRLLSATDPGLNQDRSLRAQQDSEYEQSLAMDRAKVESEMAEADRVVRAEREEAERAERAASAADAKRARLPPPPPENCDAETTELLVRLPSGNRLQRRFYGSDTIGDVYDFVDVEGGGELEEGGYNLIVPMPRVAFEDRSVTLHQAELLQRAMLVVDRK